MTDAKTDKLKTLLAELREAVMETAANIYKSGTHYEYKKCLAKEETVESAIQKLFEGGD